MGQTSSSPPPVSQSAELRGAEVTGGGCAKGGPDPAGQGFVRLGGAVTCAAAGLSGLRMKTPSRGALRRHGHVRPLQSSS